MKYIAYAIGALLALAAISQAEAAPVGFVTGDSFSNGQHDWQSYTTLTTMKTTAIGGQRLYQMAEAYEEQLDWHIAEYSIDFAVIQGGTNDISGRRTLAQMSASIDQMASIAESRGIQYFVMNIAPRTSINFDGVRENILEYNSWLYEAYGDKVIDIYNLLEDPNAPMMLNPLYDIDGVHVKWTAAVMMADMVDSAVMSSTSPVPVPASAWMFCSALIGLAGIGRGRS